MKKLSSLLLLFSLLLSNAAPAQEAYWEYTFRPGDNIWKIARDYTTSADNWLKIKNFNRVASGQDLIMRPGTRIKIPVSLLKVQPAHARITALHGDVRIIDAQGETVDATLQSRLRSGDRILTGDHASATLRFADGSELLLLPNSEAHMDTLSAHGNNGMVDTRVRLKSGQIDTRVKPQRNNSRFEIITPAAVAAVRGTAFRVSADAGRMRSEVTEGVVGVAAGKDEQPVQAGYGLVAEKGKPLPQPVRLLPAPGLAQDLRIAGYRQAIDWQAVAGAVGYRVQLAPTVSFDRLLVDRIETTTRTTLPELDNGSYALRVRAVDTHGLQGMNATAAVDIHIVPAVAEPQISQTGNRLQFSWADNEHIASTQIDIARDAGFDDMVERLQVSGNHANSGPLPEGNYYYRLKHTDRRGVSSEYSKAQAVAIEADNPWPFFLGAGVLILLL